MTGNTTTVGIEVRTDGTQKAARDLADVDASLKKIGTDLGGTAQPAVVAAQGLEQLGAAVKAAGAGLGTAGQAAGAASQKFSGVGASAKKAAEGLGSVSKFASTAKFDKLTTDLGAMGVKLNANSLHAQKLAKAMQQVERERAFQQLAHDANLSTLQLAKFRAELGDTRGALATLSNGLGLSKAAMLAFAAAVAFGGQACLEAALQADRLSKAYTTITGSSSAASQQLSYLYDVSNRLGLQFQSTAEAAKTFFAAGKGTSLENDLNGIFEAVSSAGAALALSTDDMHGVFLALGQMISKGKVQAEELRGQLGERLPGAFQLAAKAMGMTTAQLDKFMADGKLTAEELLPKLAKVMQQDFGAAAEAAAYGLQGQMNRLSTEWTRLKSAMLDSDSVASVFGTLAEAMKSLADNGEIVAAVVGKGLEWAIWAASVYTFIKSIAGLVTVFQTLKAVAGAVSFASVATAARPVAAALGLVAVAIGSVTSEQDSGEDIGRRYASVSSDIAAALKKQAQAANDAKNGTEQLSESQKKLSVSQAIEDQARALQEMQSLATGKGWLEMIGLGGDSDEAVAKIKEKTIELLTAIRTGQGDVSKLVLEIDKLGTTSDSAAKLAASILKWFTQAEKAGKVAGGEFVIVINALKELIATGDEAKASLSTGWTINVADAIKGIAALEKGIRAFQSERLGMKGSKLVDILSGYSPEQVKRAREAYASKGFGMALKELGIAIGSLTAEQEKNLNTAFRLEKQYDAESNATEAYRKALREAEKDHTSAYNRMENNAASYKSEVEQTEASIRSLQAQLATKPGDVFSRERSKIFADYEAAYAKINEEADKYARKKGITKTQAEELKNQKLTEAALQRDFSLRQAQEKEEKRLADLAKDRYEFYKELEEITGQYGLSLKYQSEMIEGQVKQLRLLGIPDEYINQWRELKELQASRDWADGAQRAFLQYRADATDAAKGAEEAFSGLYSGMDSGWKSAWEQMIETGKVSLSSFRSLFASFLVDLMHMAITRPITVQIAGVVSGMLGTGGAGGTGGLMGNIPFSSVLTNSWTSGGLLSGISNTINGWGASLLPSAFASSGTLATAGQAVNAIPGMAGTLPTGTLLGTLGAAGAGFGLGSLAGSLLFPGNRGVSTGSGIGGGLGAAIGSVVPGIGTFLGGAVGSLFGGAVGSLFGGKKPKRPATKEKLALNLGGYADGDMSYTLPGDWSGDATAQKVTDYYAVLAHSWNGMGQEAEDQFVSTIAGAAQSAVEQAQSLQKLLPESYSEAFQKELQARPIELFYRYRDKDIDDGTLTEIAAEIQEETNRVMLSAFQALDFSEYAGKIDVDQSSLEGMTLCGNAVAVVDETLSAIKELQEPTSEWETAAKSAVAQMKAWEETMKSTGVTAEYAVQLMEDYRGAYIDNFITTLDESLHPLSAYAQAVNDANDAVDQRKQALEIMGATEEQLARVESMRAEVVKQATDEMLRSFEQDVTGRIESVIGGGDAYANIVKQANELVEIESKFGFGSHEYERVRQLQEAENAQSSYNVLLEKLHALEAERIRLQQEEISELTSLINEWKSVEKALESSRYGLWTGSANIDLFSRRDTSESEFKRLYEATLGGDADAASQLSSVGVTLLELYKQTASSESEYLDVFYEVDQKLKESGKYAAEHVSEQQKQLDVLNAQLEVDAEQQLTLSEIEAQLAELGPQLDASFSALSDALKYFGVEIVGSSSSGIDSGSGGIYNGRSQKDILAEKVADLNATGYMGKTWTEASALAKMIRDYGSFTAWYEQVGHPVEGFATGGLTPRNEFFKVGEHGEELMLSPSQWVVLNNDMTRKLEDMSSLQTQSYCMEMRAVPSMSFSGTIDFSPLISELREVKNYMRQLLIRTGEGTGETSKIRKMLRKWDDMGTPPFRDGVAQVAALPAFAQARTVS